MNVMFPNRHESSIVSQGFRGGGAEYCGGGADASSGGEADASGGGGADASGGGGADASGGGEADASGDGSITSFTEGGVRRSSTMMDFAFFRFLVVALVLFTLMLAPPLFVFSAV